VLALGAAVLGQEELRLAWSDTERATLTRMQAQVQRDGRGFFAAAGERFLVRTDIDAQFATECALYMDGFAKLFQEVVSGPVVWDVKPEAVVFGTERDFRRQTGRQGRGWTPYRYDGSGRVLELWIATYADGTVEKKFSTFYRPILHHEGAHALLRRHVGSRAIPPWFDEGLATFLQFVDPREQRERAFLDRDARSQFLWRLEGDVKRKQLMPLRELIGKDRAAWEPDPDAGAHNEFGPLTMRNYAYAESFVSFLMRHGAEGRKFIDAAFDAVRNGRDFLKEVDGKKLAELERAWHQTLPSQVQARARAGRSFVEAETVLPRY
jgi:hypothetical protein